LLLEYSPDSGANREVVKEWEFGGDELKQNDVPYELDAPFYISDYYELTPTAWIRFRSDANSDSNDFSVDNEEFAGLRY